MKKIAACCLLVLLSSCATVGGPRTVHYPHPVTPELQGQFDAAEKLYLSRNVASADASLERFIAQAPYTELTDEARFLRGEIAFVRKQYPQAVTLYRSAYSDIASPLIEPKARFKAGLALFRMTRPSEALLEISPIRRDEASAVLRLRIDSLGVTASTAAKALRSDVTLWYLRVLDDYADGAAKERISMADEKIVPEREAELNVKRWVDDPSVAAAEIEAMPLKEMKGKRSGGYVMYKLAKIYHTSGDSKYAARLLRTYIASYPKHEYYGSARLLMSELGGVIGDASGVAVGVILPLSGRNGIYGQSVQHGVECAIGLTAPCVGPSGIRILVRDSESFPGGTAAAVEDIAKDKDVIAIVGPLQSNGALEAAQKAQELGIPLISLSQRPGIAEVGDYIFRNSVSTASEMDTLVRYAMDELKLRRFFILYPNNRKAAEYFRLFSTAVKDRGGSIVKSSSYSPASLVATNELRGRGAVEMGMQERTVELDVGGVSYDAMFIPDAAGVVGPLMKQVESAGASKGRLLGISRWNDPSLVGRGGSDVEGSVFVTSLFKESLDPEVMAFITRMREAYRMEPTLLEALGYDTMRMVTASVQGSNAKRRSSMKDALVRMKDFPGVAGKTSFDEQGDAVREMWVLTVKGGKIVSAK